MVLLGLTFNEKGRRSGEAAKGTHKRILWAVALGVSLISFFLSQRLLPEQLKTTLQSYALPY